VSKTKRSKQVLLNNWSYKSSYKADFAKACDKCYDGDLLGFKPKKRQLLNAYEDKVPSAVSEVKYLSQCK
jgi:BarA-like signal transduction histidine kinase